MKSPICTALLAMMLCVVAAKGQTPRSDTIPIAATGSSSYLVFPFIVHSAETGWGFGGISAVFFQPNKKKDSITRTSNASLLALYTTKKQLVLAVNAGIFFPHENNLVRFQGSYSYFPAQFWGLGNHSPSALVESYSQEQYVVNPQFLHRVHRKFYIGVSYEFQHTGPVTYTPNGIFDQQNIVGRYGGNTSGIGPLVTIDTRNNAFSPTRGTFAELQYIFYGNATGSDFNFTLFNLDLRQFISFSGKSVLALQAISGLGSGAIPFRKLEQIGGSDMMRGYYAGRFTDKCLVAGQAEWRQFLFWRLGAVGFAALGQVAPGAADFCVDGFHYSWGGGLRFMLSKKEKLNLRIDYGTGASSNAFNVQLREAF